MRQNTLEIEDGINSFVLTFSDRDFSLLGGPEVFMPCGVEFIKALGVYENTCVAMNMQPPPNSMVRRNRGYFLIQAKGLLNYLRRDADLLSYDYSFRLTKGEDKHRVSRELRGFRIRDFFGAVDGSPHGFCTLTLSEVSPTGLGRNVEIIDLRTRTEVETDDKGTLKIYRKEASFGWSSVLPKLIQFLESSSQREIVIHHN